MGTRCNVLQVHGADSQIRTGDLILTKDALYRLSYISTLSCDNGRILSYRMQKIKPFFQAFLGKDFHEKRSHSPL